MEALLVARPPKSMLTLNAERREAMDRPHKEAIARVDAWLKEQLAEGPVAYDVLAERAGAAGIAVRNARAPALGWGRCSLGQTAQRLGVFPVVAYDGDNEEELAAAAQWEDDTIYWTLRRTKGLMVLPGNCSGSPFPVRLKLADPITPICSNVRACSFQDR